MPILKFQCSSCGLSSRKRVQQTKNRIKCDCGAMAQVAQVFSFSWVYLESRSNYEKFSHRVLILLT